MDHLSRCRIKEVGNPAARGYNGERGISFKGVRPRQPMSLLRDEDIVEIRKQFENLINPVKLVHFTQELNLEYGREARLLLQELTTISDKISLDVFNFLIDKEKVAEYGVDKVPATVVRNGRDYGIRFYGIPAGYEFSNLLDAIISVSVGNSGLSEETKEKLKAITKPLHLEVFVTPT